MRTCNRKAIEWPTAFLAVGIYGGWASLTFFSTRLSSWLVAALGAWLIAWHSSLQHEILHGHPTRWPRINAALGFLPLSLWLPYARYRATHLRHHRDERLTDPLDDPESAYLTPEAWRALPPLGRLLIAAQMTLLGRLLLGPAWRVGCFLRSELAAIAAGEPGSRRIWAIHALGALLVALWLTLVCGMSLGFYLGAIVYPGTALLLLRAFAEHRADAEVSRRTAIVERAWLLGPLFLFNNLHAAHHERPGLAWYALPRWYHRHRARLLAANGGLLYRGYLDVARRYLLAPYDSPAHPLGATASKGNAEPAQGSWLREFSGSAPAPLLAQEREEHMVLPLAVDT